MLSETTTGSKARKRVSVSPAAAGLASALGLVVEVSYTRLASVMLWPTFVYLVIGIALLGFGLPGLVLSIWRAELEGALSRRPAWLWGAFAVCSLLPWATLAVFDERRLFYALFAGALALPFACAGMVCTLAITTGTDVRRAVAGSTLGGVVGTVVATVVTPTLGIPLVLFGAAATSLAAAASVTAGARQRAVALVALVAVASLGAWSRDAVPPGQRLKWFPLFSQVPGFAREFSRWDPVARIDVTDFGAGYVSPDGDVRFKLLTQDFTAPSFFLNFQGERAHRLLLRRIESAGYWARPSPERVLIIGVGGGPDVQAALYLGAGRVDAVEINATTLKLLVERYDSWLGSLGRDPRVRWIHDDGGHFLRAARDRYDLIQMSGVDTDVASISGTSRIAENYLYTKELISTAVEHLTPDGLLVFAWADYSAFLPVKERMFTTMLEVLADRGISEPGRHLVVAGTGGTFSILLKHSPFEPAEIERVAAQMKEPFPEGAFEMMYRVVPGVEKITPTRPAIFYAPGDAGPSFFTAALEELASGRRWNRLSASFNLEPATNDRPFFFIVDRPDGSTVTVRRHLTVLQISGLAALVLLAVPLLARRRSPIEKADAFSVLALWSLGWGFAAAQVVLLQQSVYIVGHPALAVAVVIAALLASMTAGNLLSARLAAPPGRVLAWSCVALAVTLTAFGSLHAAVAQLVDPAPLAVRVVAAALLVALPGLAMGAPFPTALQLLTAARPRVVPWGLAANASANSVSMVASGMTCWFLGFQATMVLSAAAYALGTVVLLRLAAAIEPAPGAAATR